MKIFIIGAVSLDRYIIIDSFPWMIPWFLR